MEPQRTARTLPTNRELKTNGLDKFSLELSSVALSILPGLLASGHFTSPSTVPNDNEPQIFWFDGGPDWKELGLPKRHSYHAVDAAFALARDFLLAAKENHQMTKRSKAATRQQFLAIREQASKSLP